MSMYATREDLSLGLADGALTDVDDAVIDSHLMAASTVADGYLAGRGYQLPLSDWGHDLRACVARIAAWTILVHARGVNPNNPAHAALMKAHDDSMAWLRDVSKGVVQLALFVGEPPRARQGVVQVFSVGDEEPRGW